MLWKEIEKEALKFNFNANLIIIGGYHDLRNNEFSSKAFVGEIKEKIKDLSHTNIKISSIPFRYDIHFLNNKIRQLNKRLETLTEKCFFYEKTTTQLICCIST